MDKVEKMTGIDFFSQLPDDLERVLEADTLSHVSRMGDRNREVYIVQQEINRL